jgi:hypothetical protein
VVESYKRSVHLSCCFSTFHITTVSPLSLSTYTMLAKILLVVAFLLALAAHAVDPRECEVG